MNFLETQGYQPFISDWIYGQPSQYAIIDINKDGIEELIITGGDGVGLYNFSVFSYDKASNDIYAVSISGSVIYGEGYAGNIAQYYGSLWCSSKYHALVFTELNHSSMFDSYGYFVMDDRKPIADFSLWFERDDETQQISYGITNSCNRETISNDEYTTYISELSTLAFKPMPSSDAPGEINFEAAKEAILKYYNNLREDDGTYIITDYDIIEDNGSYFVGVRYQMSDQEAEEKISNGGFPEANVLAGTVTIDKITGSIYTDDGTIIQQGR